MFHVAFSRGRGPAYADLPPTLQPCAVAASAPPSDRVRAAALSGLIYLLLGASALTIASFAPPVSLAPPVQPTVPDRIVVFDRLQLPRPVERVTAATGGMGSGDATQIVNAGAAHQADPDEASAGTPTDRSGEIPGLANPAIGGNPALPPGNPSVGAGTGVVQDFSMVGLTVLHRVDPVYPEFARRARIQGPVVLLMTVDEGGRPIQVQVLEGHPAFHEAALQAARQWRFEPARLDGRPVAAAFRLTLKFALR
ncbi:hypothetical protein GETHLI_27100 [Geothrix limicola]|uniref:TonB C-terminal domain-containing protein n=1 Tax=Geothrix limicola TaxID=2927978 RepID=A0ABQ5QI18_9BACT|nr:energy transducer TonB [Geothrix limicola]GLH74208.1 hypothetical protein GETHLI_27100 [Geothrix limicola]